MPDKILNSLNNILEFSAANTSYYNKKVYKTKLCSISDLENLPIINKEIYKKNTLPKNDNLFTGKLTNCIVSTSSGSTGKPSYVVRNIDDFEEQNRDFIGLNVWEEDRALNLFMPGMWGVFTSANISLMQSGCTIFPYGGANIDEAKISDIIGLIQKFNINFLLGVPSTIIALAGALKNKKAITKNIDKIFCLGEKVPESSVKFIEEVFANAIIKSKYGCMESAGIAYQCQHLSANHYHIFDDRFVEITDKNGIGLEQGDIGDILVTTLNKRLVPLIRYNTGDKGSMMDTKCKCGEKGVLTVLNREDDEFVFGSIHISLSRLEKAIYNTKGLPVNYQVCISKKGNLDEMNIKFETNKKITNSNKLEKALKQAVYELDEDIVEAISSKKIKDIKIDFYKEGELERKEGSGKIRKLIDLR